LKQYHRLLTPTLVISCCAIWLFIQGRIYAHTADDAFISLAYAKNLSNGDGLVFNLGERVEGYTNFLWILLLTIPHLILLDATLFAELMGFCATVGTLVTTFLLSLKITPKRPILYHFIPSILLAANGAFSYWTFSGMETALFTFLLSMGVYHYVRVVASSKTSLLPSLFWGLASITRPEGILLFILTTAHYLLHLKKQRKISLFTISKWILPFSSLVVPHFIFRFLYYESFLPNTYFAKNPPWYVAIEFGLSYTSQFLVEYGLWGMGIITPTFLLFVSSEKKNGTYIALIIWVYYAYVISVGGDVLGAHRFFVPILPMLYLSFQEGIYRLLHLLPWKNENLKEKPDIIPTFCLLLITGAITYVTHSLPQKSLLATRDFSIHHNAKLKDLATYINQLDSSTNLVVATGAIGIPKYFTDARIIDLIGLTDSTIARHSQTSTDLSSPSILRKHNTPYVLSNAPDLIFFVTGTKPQTVAEKSLFLSEEFRRGYYVSHFRNGFKAFVQNTSYKPKKPKKIHNEPGFVDYYINGLNALNRNDTTAVIKYFTKCISVAPPDFSYPYSHLGALFFYKKQIDKAKNYFLQAINIDPYNVHSHSYLALINMTQNTNLDGSIRLVEKAITLSPESHFARFVYGLCLMSVQRLDDAIDQLKKSIELKGPNMQRAMVFIGQAYFQKGEYEQARYAWESVLKINPELTIPKKFLELLPNSKNN